MRIKAAMMVLVALAAAKLGAQEYLYRSATNEVLIGAYRERAIQACQRDPRNQGLMAHTGIWSKPNDVRIVIGKGDLDVWFWQVDNSLWDARYRNPYIHLAIGDRLTNISCEYDIVNGIANVSRG